MQAAGEGDTAKVTSLLNAGMDINAKDAHGDTALLWAESSGDPDTIKQRDAKITIVPISGGIIWDLPLERGLPEVVRLLIERGANVNIQDSTYGRTPLMWAARNMYGDLVKLLLGKGADRSIKDRDGQTALTLTPDLAPSLVQVLSNGDKSTKPSGLNAPDQSGRTPLMYAALTGDVDQVKKLLQQGADVNAVGDYGQTALISAARGSAAVVQLLLDKGAKVNAGDKSGWTPLMSAARFGTAETMGLLINAGADVNAEGKYDGKTVLMVASEVRPDRQSTTAAGQERNRQHFGKG